MHATCTCCCEGDFHCVAVVGTPNVDICADSSAASASCALSDISATSAQGWKALEHRETAGWCTTRQRTFPSNVLPCLTQESCLLCSAVCHSAEARCRAVQGSESPTSSACGLMYEPSGRSLLLTGPTWPFVGGRGRCPGGWSNAPPPWLLKRGLALWLLLTRMLGSEPHPRVARNVNSSAFWTLPSDSLFSHSAPHMTHTLIHPPTYTPTHPPAHPFTQHGLRKHGLPSRSPAHTLIHPHTPSPNDARPHGRSGAHTSLLCRAKLGVAVCVPSGQHATWGASHHGGVFPPCRDGVERAQQGGGAA